MLSEENYALATDKKNVNGKQYLVITVCQPILDEQQNVVGIIETDIDTNVPNNTKFNDGEYKSFSNVIIKQ